MELELGFVWTRWEQAAGPPHNRASSFSAACWTTQAHSPHRANRQRVDEHCTTSWQNGGGIGVEMTAVVAFVSLRFVLHSFRSLPLPRPLGLLPLASSSSSFISILSMVRFLQPYSLSCQFAGFSDDDGAGVEMPSRRRRRCGAGRKEAPFSKQRLARH